MGIIEAAAVGSCSEVTEVTEVGVGNTVVLPVIFVSKGTTVRRNTSIKIRSLKEELVVVRLHCTTTLKPLPIH